MKALQLARCDFDDTPTEVRITLGALVTPAVVVDITTPLAEVRRLLVQRRGFLHIAVLAAERVCGLVTRTDVLRVADADATAADAMSSFVFALPASASVERAAALIAYEGVGQIVVMAEDGTLVGMVSAIDIARHFAARCGYVV
jgi:CBS domain-containing protein